MPFGVASVVTNIGKAIFADRQRTTPGTYAASPKYVAIGTGATAAARTAAVTDTALSVERVRVAGTESTVTTTNTGDTYQTQATLSISGTWAIDEIGTFDAAAAGNMSLSATVNAISLSSGDSLTVTAKEQQT